MNMRATQSSRRRALETEADVLQSDRETTRVRSQGRRPSADVHRRQIQVSRSDVADVMAL